MMNKKSLFTLALCIFICLVVILALPFDVNVKIEGNVGSAAPVIQTTAAPAVQTTTQAPETTTQPTTAPSTADSTQTTAAPGSSSGVLTDPKEILDKYSMLVNKFKKEKPAYKKKEFQALPEEFRDLGTAGNVVLDVAAGYMTTEEECEELVRAAGAEEIRWDMPIHNSDVGCVFTAYDQIAWAKCEDLGDGTYKISFSLKEEMNAEPTPGDTLVPQSVHGTVMQPISRQEITTEVEKITSKVPGLGINDFSLGYRDCEFSCIYNPETDQVKSITHHVVIDINADIQLFVANIAGSARLYNDMLIYDITW